MELILLFYCLNYFLVGVMVTVALIIAEWILFERAGQAGWKSLIPFYDSFIIHKIAFGEDAKWFWFLFIIPGYGIYVRYAFTKSYGYSVGASVASIFFPAIVTVVMAFQDRPYNGPLTHLFKQ